MAALALRILAPALLEGVDLRPARLLDDLADDARAGDAWRADVIGRAIEQSQHLVEHNPGAGFARQRHDRDFILGGNLVLFAAGLDDCEHRSFPCSARLVRMEHARPAFWQLTENAALANRGLLFEFRAQGLKTKSAAWGRAGAGEPIGGAQIKVNDFATALRMALGGRSYA
jgi:hypothetical protein